LRYYYPLLLIV